eukprot:UN4953
MLMSIVVPFVMTCMPSMRRPSSGLVSLRAITSVTSIRSSRCCRTRNARPLGTTPSTAGIFNTHVASVIASDPSSDESYFNGISESICHRFMDEFMALLVVERGDVLDAVPMTGKRRRKVRKRGVADAMRSAQDEVSS